MSEHSAIEWTDATWNPVRGCTKISPGCKHCYAETFAERFRGVPRHPFEQGFDLRLVPEKLDVPLKWRVPKRIFVNSMSDLFHEDIATEYIAKVGRVMRDAPWHTYQVLTKRHERLRDLLSGELNWIAALPHVWFGVSVEDREHGLPRLESLRHTPASVRFLSVEPLLEDFGSDRSAENRLGDRRRRKRSWRAPNERRMGALDTCGNARRRGFRSFSSNGAACTKAKPADSSTAAPTTTSPPDFQHSFDCLSAYRSQYVVTICLMACALSQRAYELSRGLLAGFALRASRFEVP